MKKWSEKSTIEKVWEIISMIASFAWIVFEVISLTGGGEWTDIASRIAIIVVCLFQSFSFWKEKRYISYISIACILAIIATFVIDFI